MSLSFIKNNLLKSDEELLYLTYFGSCLYGTYNENSDVDFKGLFLPSKKDLLLMNGRKSINWKSGNDESKNSSEDVDVELWSIHYFIELIRKGDTGAIDLLYSFTNNRTIAFLNSSVLELFENPLKLFDPRNTTSFIHYAIGQMKKYMISGSRMGMIKDVFRYLETFDNFSKYERLKDYIDYIIDNYYHESYCFTKEVNGEDALVLCGKVHLLSISIEEFYNRIKKEFNKFGERTKKAEENENIDWKSCHHALRCLYQVKELLIKGSINFPLETANILLDVKNGEYPFKEVENMLYKELKEVEQLRNSNKVVKGEHDQKFVENLILKLYEEV